MGNRKQKIPKPRGKFRTLSIPCIRDRVVQGAVKLMLEAIFEADFQPRSYGYRPKKTAAAAIEKVTVAAIKNMTRVIDVDLKSYFDTVRHDILLSKISLRVNDAEVMHLLKADTENGRKTRGSPGRTVVPVVKQHLPQRGGQNAGTGEGGHIRRWISAHRICEMGRRFGNINRWLSKMGLAGKWCLQTAL